MQGTFQALLLLLFLSSVLVQGLAPPQLPITEGALVRQAAAAISYAFQNDNIHRQTVRLPLSESMYSQKSEGFVADRAIGWQGGPQETIQYLSPLATSVLQQVSEMNVQGETGGLVARITEQTLLDFDGSVLVTAENPAGAVHDVQALLQPNTDDYYRKTIRQVEEQFSDTPGKPKRLFLLINPAWRDKNSWGFFGANQAQKEILDRYETTYALDQFVVRGQKMSLLKAWPNDWAVYLTPMPYNINENEKKDNNPRLLGTFANRPTYSQMDALLVS